MTEKIYLQKCSKVQFVIDAVYAFAFALQKMKNQLCPRHRGIIRILHNTEHLMPKTKSIIHDA